MRDGPRSPHEPRSDGDQAGALSAPDATRHSESTTMLAAHQPHYLPFPGLLAKADAADVFVVQDDLQYVKQEWQNRNRIRTPADWRWLTIPVHASSTSRIKDVRPVNRRWPAKHRRIVESFYAPEQCRRLQPLWPCVDEFATADLARINIESLKILFREFGITTPVVLQSSLRLPPLPTRSPNQRLMMLCRELNCDGYLSGSQALAYLDHPAWDRSGLSLRMLKWAPQPYKQAFSGWVANLSCVDMLMCADDPHQAVRAGGSIVKLRGGLEVQSQ